MSVIIRPAVHADAWHVLPYLQMADRHELEAAGLPLGPMLAYEIACSSDPKMAETTDGEPIALWGLVDEGVLIEEAYPWLATCDAIQEYRLRMAREGLRQLEAWRQRGYTLHGLVDDRYGAAAAWMQRVGFEIGPPSVHVGPGRQPFRPYRRA